MKRWGGARLILTLLLGLLFWALVGCACLCVGSTGAIGTPANHFIFNIRLEMVLVASLVGAALGAAGVVYQSILRNPLADPYLLGVSSGASLLSLIWYVGLFSTLSSSLQAAGQQGFAFVGALASIAVVLLIASRRGRLDPITLILVGVIVNAVNGSIYLLIYFRFPQLISRGEFTFLVGGIQTNLTAEQEWLAAALAGICWMVLFSLAGQLNVAPLGEAEAQSLGVRIHRLRWIALAVASIMTASAVAISGPIGFVGLICPHLARLVVGRDQRALFPAATFLAAGSLAVADAGSRFLSRESLLHTQMPVGVLTGLLGGPFFLLLLYQTRRKADRLA